MISSLCLFLVLVLGQNVSLIVTYIIKNKNVAYMPIQLRLMNL